MSYSRLNLGNEFYAHHVNIHTSGSITLVSGETYQGYLIFTQRRGLFTVWNANGNLEKNEIVPVSGVTFSASGNKDVKLTWSIATNLHVCVMSYSPFTIQR